jgi:hypothetical protein
MKKVFVLVSLWFMANAVFGQAYIITFIKGKVYYNNQLLKLHDKVDGIAQLTSDDKTAELALFSAQKGKFRLSFVDSKPLQAHQKAKNSELYQLIVGNYLLGYTTEKTLTTRGGFDMKAFFTPSDTGHAGSNAYVAAGEMLPIKSQSVVFGANDEFFVCSVSGKDTSYVPIRRTAGYLVFDEALVKALSGSINPEPVYCFIRRSYRSADKLITEPFSAGQYITFLSTAYLHELVSTFDEGKSGYYQGEKSKMIADMEDQLAYYYGKSFEPAVRHVLNAGLEQP